MLLNFSDTISSSTLNHTGSIFPLSQWLSWGLSSTSGMTRVCSLRCFLAAPDDMIFVAEEQGKVDIRVPSYITRRSEMGAVVGQA